MVQAADYIYKKLKEEDLLSLAFNWKKEAGTDKFPLVRKGTVYSTIMSTIQVCTGHSLGGGTAAILSILLREEYPDVTCYAYSPPGGLLR